MKAKVAIVEDEMLVACHLEDVVQELGHVTVGIAADLPQATALLDAAPDVALVDLNLRDGLTGPEIGKLLGERGTTVIFVTANPQQVSPPIPNALGVLPKPCNDDCVRSALDYALSVRAGRSPIPPEMLQAF